MLHVIISDNHHLLPNDVQQNRCLNKILNWMLRPTIPSEGVLNRLMCFCSTEVYSTERQTATPTAAKTSEYSTSLIERNSSCISIYSMKALPIALLIRLSIYALRPQATFAACTHCSGTGYIKG